MIAKAGTEHRTLLRSHEDRDAAVTPVELFFDLVFVFAVTQISHFLLQHLTWVGALEAAFLLLAVWSCWVDTVLVTNLLDPARQRVRVLLFLLMGAGLIFAAALPEAFAEGGLIFAIAFALFQFGRTLFMAWAVRAERLQLLHFTRMSVWTAFYCLFWVAGGLAEDGWRFGLWAIALIIDYIAPAFGYPLPYLGGGRFNVLDIRGRHVSERIGLFIIIALGESVLVTGATFAELAWTTETIAALASALLGSIAMWWIYFAWSNDLARTVIDRASDPSRFIVRAFGYVPWVVVAGIVITAVGDDLILAEPEHHASAAAATVLIGGPALFLFGALLFEYGAFGKWSLIRLGGLVALPLLSFVAPSVPILVLSLAATAVLVAVALAEFIWLSGRHGPLRPRTLEEQ